MRRLGLGVLGTARGRYAKGAPALPTRWLSGVAVQWRDGMREMTHEGVTWQEVPTGAEEGAAVFYWDGENSVYAEDLPFNVEEADPDVEMTLTGFRFKPTQTHWTRAEGATESDTKQYYFYKGDDVLWMQSSLDPELQIAAARAAAAEVEAAADAGSVEHEAVEHEAHEAAVEAPDAAEEKEATPEPAVVEEEALPPTPPHVEDVLEVAVVADVAVADVAVADVAVADAAPAATITAAEPAEPEPEKQAAPEGAVPEVPAAAEKEERPEEATAVVPAEEEDEVAQKEARHLDKAKERAKALLEAADTDGESTALVPQSIPRTLAKSIQDYNGEMDVALPEANPLLVPEEGSDAQTRMRVRVARSADGSDDYAVHMEGLRGAMYQLASEELKVQEAAATNEDVKEYLREKKENLAYQAWASKELSLSLAKSVATEDTRRYLALPFDPLQGVGTLLLPSDAQRHVLRYLVDVVSLSRLVTQPDAVNHILESEQSLAAAVLDAQRELKKGIEESKHDNKWKSRESKKELSAKRALAHHAAETHNGYIFWNSLRVTPQDTTTPASIHANEFMLRAIEQQWGSYEAFRQDFAIRAQSMMGTGYVWLAFEEHEELKERAMVKLYDEEKAKEAEAAADDVQLLSASTEEEEPPAAAAEGTAEKTSDGEVNAEGEGKTATDGEDGEKAAADAEPEPEPEPEPEVVLDPTPRMLNEMRLRDAKGELVHDNLRIVTTLRSESPLTYGFKPLFGVDTTAAQTLGDSPLTDLEKEDMADFGIKLYDTENFIYRYLDNVDYRRAEYQLRLCFPAVLATDAGLAEAAGCVRPAPGEQLHALSMQMPPMPKAEAELYNAMTKKERAKYDQQKIDDARMKDESRARTALLGPVSQLKRVCNKDLPSDYWYQTKVMSDEAYMKRTGQARQEAQERARARPNVRQLGVRSAGGGKGSSGKGSSGKGSSGGGGKGSRGYSGPGDRDRGSRSDRDMDRRQGRKGTDSKEDRRPQTADRGSRGTSPRDSASVNWGAAPPPPTAAAMNVGQGSMQPPPPPLEAKAA